MENVRIVLVFKKKGVTARSTLAEHDVHIIYCETKRRRRRRRRRRHRASKKDDRLFPMKKKCKKPRHMQSASNRNDAASVCINRGYICTVHTCTACQKHKRTLPELLLSDEVTSRNVWAMNHAMPYLCMCMCFSVAWKKKEA